jgi:hypothetical protein
MFAAKRGRRLEEAKESAAGWPRRWAAMRFHEKAFWSRKGRFIRTVRVFAIEQAFCIQPRPKIVQIWQKSYCP